MLNTFPSKWLGLMLLYHVHDNFEIILQSLISHLLSWHQLEILLLLKLAVGLISDITIVIVYRTCIITDCVWNLTALGTIIKVF